MKINLLKEIEEQLANKNFTWDDVKTVSVDGQLISVNRFRELADIMYDNEYDEEFKNSSVSIRPIVVYMKDNSYFKRKTSKSKSIEEFAYTSYPTATGEENDSKIDSLLNPNYSERDYVWVVRLYKTYNHNPGEDFDYAGEKPDKWGAFNAKSKAVDMGMCWFEDLADEEGFPRDEDGDVLNNELEDRFKCAQEELESDGHSEWFGVEILLDFILKDEIEEYDKKYLTEVKSQIS